METKYNVGDTVLILASVGSIKVNNKGKIHYDITFFESDGLTCHATIKEKDIYGRAEFSDKVSSTDV